MTLHTARVPSKHDERVAERRYRIVRCDGVVLGSSASRLKALRMLSVVLQGQRADFATLSEMAVRYDA